MLQPFHFGPLGVEHQEKSESYPHGIGLQLQEERRQFHVAPTAVKDTLESFGCVKKHSQAQGRLSPKSELTLPDAAKKRFNIPAEASHYHFAYPLSGFNDDVGAGTEQTHESAGRSEPAFCLFAVGGFIYLNEKRRARG